MQGPSAECTTAVHPVSSLGKSPQNSPLSRWGKVLAKNNFILFEDGWQRKQVDGISNNKPMTHFWGPETICLVRKSHEKSWFLPPPSGTPVQLEFLRGPEEMSASHFPPILFFFTYFIFHKYLSWVVFVYITGLFLIPS